MSEETVVADTQPVETQAPVDVTTKIEAPAETLVPEVKADETPPADKPETTDEPTDEPKKKPSGLDRLKRRLVLAQEAADVVARENEELRRRTVASGPREGKPGIDRPPTEQDFPNDYLAFEASRTEWNVRQAVRQEMSKAEVAKRDTVLREVHQERVEAYEENAAEVRERIPDFDKVLSESKTNASRALLDELWQSEKAALLQYHLAQKPELVRELNEMSGRELAKAIGKLEARVHLPTPKKVTEAAPPPSQVRGAAAQVIDPRVGPDDMNEYVKWREKQRAKAS